MNMLELLGGVVIGGIAGVALKDKVLGSNAQNEAKSEIERLYIENEKYSNRNKELERQVEDLLAELKKVRKDSQYSIDKYDDLEYKLDKANIEIKRLLLENEELAQKVADYRVFCDSKEAEIERLKRN